MEMNEPVSSPEQTNNPPVVDVTTPQKPVVNGPITWLLLALAVLLLGTTGVFAYKYYQLKQERKQTEPISSPASVPSSPTSMPIIDGQPETDNETRGWEVYTNTKVGFVIKYPSRYSKPKLPTGPTGPNIYADGSEEAAHLVFGEMSGDSFVLQFSQYNGPLVDLIKEKETPSTSERVLIRRTKVDETVAEWYVAMPPIIYTDNVEVGKLEVFFIENGYGFFLTTSRDHPEDEIEQLLSTFEFTN